LRITFHEAKQLRDTINFYLQNTCK